MNLPPLPLYLENILLFLLLFFPPLHHHYPLSFSFPITPFSSLSLPYPTLILPYPFPPFPLHSIYNHYVDDE
ncbi:hypothetical protein F4775DRAFT_561383 [Biscogniauxia sp. FL1348]|nr:hypothetical protein F4775DRAFT_561383 [Biscogniauxia sp. FL1348]